jgi:hypothetical protein
MNAGSAGVVMRVSLGAASAGAARAPSAPIATTAERGIRFRMTPFYPVPQPVKQLRGNAYGTRTERLRVLWSAGDHPFG